MESEPSWLDRAVEALKPQTPDFFGPASDSNGSHTPASEEPSWLDRVTDGLKPQVPDLLGAATGVYDALAPEYRDPGSHDWLGADFDWGDIGWGGVKGPHLDGHAGRTGTFGFETFGFETPFSGGISYQSLADIANPMSFANHGVTPPSVTIGQDDFGVNDLRNNQDLDFSWSPPVKEGSPSGLLEMLKTIKLWGGGDQDGDGVREFQASLPLQLLNPWLPNIKADVEDPAMFAAMFLAPGGMLMAPDIASRELFGRSLFGDYNLTDELTMGWWDSGEPAKQMGGPVPKQTPPSNNDYGADRHLFPTAPYSYTPEPARESAAITSAVEENHYQYGADPAAESALIREASRANAPETTTSGRGDSLSTIAARLSEEQGRTITWQELYEANKPHIGADPNGIRIGQSFVVPKASTPSPSPHSSPSPARPTQVPRGVPRGRNNFM